MTSGGRFVGWSLTGRAVWAFSVRQLIHEKSGGKKVRKRKGMFRETWLGRRARLCGERVVEGSSELVTGSLQLPGSFAKPCRPPLKPFDGGEIKLALV